MLPSSFFSPIGKQGDWGSLALPNDDADGLGINRCHCHFSFQIAPSTSSMDGGGGIHTTPGGTIAPLLLLSRPLQALLHGIRHTPLAMGRLDSDNGSGQPTDGRRPTARFW
ncbi:unnamed protein product [Urochloa humidicola]